MEQPVKAAGWDLSVQGTQWGQGAGYMSLPLTLERRESHGSFKQETDLPFKESSLAAIGRREQKGQSWMGWVVDGLDGGWWCTGVLAARKRGQITAPNGGLTVAQGGISALTDRWHHHEMGTPGWIRCEGNVGL